MIGRGLSFQCHHHHHYHHHDHHPHPLKILKLGTLLLLFVVLLLPLRAKAWLDHLQEENVWRHHQPMYSSNKGFTFRDRIVVTSLQPKIRREVSTITPALQSSSSSSSSSSSVKQPGSRPPECKNACPGCPSDCVARPVYVLSTSSSYQHALWSCMCAA